MTPKKVNGADPVLDDVVTLALALAKLSDALALHRLALMGATHEATTALGTAASDLGAFMDPVTANVLDLQEQADHLTVLASSIGRRLPRRARPPRSDDHVTWLRKQLDGLQDGGGAA